MTIVELIDEEYNNNNNITGKVKKTILGQDIFKENHVLQHVVKRDTWFGCYCDNDNEFSLVGCTVSPGFDFNDFELASRTDLISKYPKEAEDVIIKLTEGLP